VPTTRKKLGAITRQIEKIPLQHPKSTLPNPSSTHNITSHHNKHPNSQPEITINLSHLSLRPSHNIPRAPTTPSFAPPQKITNSIPTHPSIHITYNPSLITKEDQHPSPYTSTTRKNKPSMPSTSMFRAQKRLNRQPCS
jgi:hypothetical protein